MAEMKKLDSSAAFYFAATKGCLSSPKRSILCSSFMNSPSSSQEVPGMSVLGVGFLWEPLLGCERTPPPPRGAELQSLTPQADSHCDGAALPRVSLAFGRGCPGTASPHLGSKPPQPAWPVQETTACRSKAIEGGGKGKGQDLAWPGGWYCPRRKKHSHLPRVCFLIHGIRKHASISQSV